MAGLRKSRSLLCVLRSSSSLCGRNWVSARCRHAATAVAPSDQQTYVDDTGFQDLISRLEIAEINTQRTMQPPLRHMPPLQPPPLHEHLQPVDDLFQQKPPPSVNKAQSAKPQKNVSGLQKNARRQLTERKCKEVKLLEIEYDFADIITRLQEAEALEREPAKATASTQAKTTTPADMDLSLAAEEPQDSSARLGDSSTASTSTAPTAPTTPTASTMLDIRRTSPDETVPGIELLEKDCLGTRLISQKKPVVDLEPLPSDVSTFMLKSRQRQPRG